jgi:ribosome biogenesis GTPase
VAASGSGNGFFAKGDWLMRGLLIKGSRNMFTIRPLEGDSENEALECKIKGKVLKGVEGYYNPLAPGDYVHYETDPQHPALGLINALEPRRNAFTRLNQKGVSSKRYSGNLGHENAPGTSVQLLAANVDLAACVASPVSPPWRPRFIDRFLVQAESASIPALIICNKWDLTNEDDDTLLDIDERLQDYHDLGYAVLRVSAKTGLGMDELRRLLEGRVTVFAGQSGVGKSSLINALLPGSAQRTGDINEKYERGNHTTSQACFIDAPSIRIIDTPGVRLFLPANVSADDLILYFREFAPLAGRCSYGMSCSHTVEPGCKILEAVQAGYIHEDRYESYLRLRDELASLPAG